MPLKVETREIGAFNFRVQQLPYMASQRLFVRLMRIAGPGLMGLATNVGSMGKGGVKVAMATLLDADMTVVAMALSKALEQLDPDEAENITKTVLSTTFVERENAQTHEMQFIPFVGVMDRVLDGDFWTGLSVQAFALSVHFGNFNIASVASASKPLAVEG